MGSLRQVAVTLAGIIALAAVALAPAARANMALGNYNLQIMGRYDFHTWLWSISWCNSACVHVNATAMPVAKAFNYAGGRAAGQRPVHLDRRCSRRPAV